MRGTGTLYGVLVTGACMALATAVSLACLSKADQASRAAYAQDAALCEVQTAADLAAAYQGDLCRVEHAFGGTALDGILTIEYDREMRRTHGGEAAYVLELGPVSINGLLRTCPARMRDLEGGRDVFYVTASWQGGIGGDGT